MTRENMIIGELAAQRNAALDAVVSARVELAVVSSHASNMREVLADLVRSDSLRHEDVQRIMSDESFASWYQQKYPQAA